MNLAVCVFTFHSLELESVTVPFRNSWTAACKPCTHSHYVPWYPCTYSHYWELWEEWHRASRVMLHNASADPARADAEERWMRSWISEGNSAETLCISLANKIFHFWCRMRKIEPTHKQCCIRSNKPMWKQKLGARKQLWESNFRSSQ